MVSDVPVPARPDTLQRETRFSVVQESLIRDDAISDRAFRLWCILDRYAGANGAAFPARSTLAKDLRCSVDTIDRALAELVAAGWLGKEKRQGGTTNSYTLTEGRTGAARVPQGCGPDSRTGAAQKEASVKDASLTDPPFLVLVDAPEAPADPLVDEFAGFWRTYPKRVEKKAAERAYRKARKTVPVAVIRNGLLVAVRGWAGVDLKYVPNPATWLNGERWNDEVPAAADLNANPDGENAWMRRRPQGHQL